jgi:hypothetical protein
MIQTPMTRLFRHLAARFVIAERVLELSLGVDRAAGKALAVLLCAQQKAALAVDVSVRFDPETVAPFPVAETIPFGFVQFLAVKFIVTGEFPLRAFGSRRKKA